MACSAGPDVSESGLVLALDAGDRYSFTLTEVEVLVVAGGGGGAADVGGGGGAGGLIYNRNFAVTPGSALTVTVGAGGSGRAPSDTSAGGNGGNSVFGSITATGGGGGGNYFNGSGTTGGSGGGGGGVSGTGGAGTSGQGFAGGSGNGQYFQSGGGGGAGEAGKTGSGIVGGNGGNGLEFPQFASIGGYPSGWFAGGGGGGGGNDSGSDGRGYGGLGGGGTGAARSGTYNTNSSFRDAVANTGGGGGGTGGWNTAGNGGSGIVIVRYPGPQRAIGGTVTFSGGHTIHTFTTVGSTTFTPLSASNGNTILGLSDLSNTGNFGTTANSPTYSSSNGGSVSFDGSNEYIEVLSNGKSTIFDTQSYSIESIFYRTDDGENVLWSFDYTSHSGPYYSQHLRMSGNTLYFLWNNSSTYQFISQTVSNLNQWTSVTATFTSGYQGLYVNGSLVASSTRADTITYYNQEIWIGRGNYATSEFSGRIASTKFYNRALTATEISQNFNATRARFGI